MRCKRSRSQVGKSANDESTHRRSELDVVFTSSIFFLRHWTRDLECNHAYFKSTWRSHLHVIQLVTQRKRLAGPSGLLTRGSQDCHPWSMPGGAGKIRQQQSTYLLYLLLRFATYQEAPRHTTPTRGGPGVYQSCEAVAGRRQLQTILWHSGEDLSSQDVTRV